jgi:hypothetical protein
MIGEPFLRHEFALHHAAHRRQIGEDRPLLAAGVRGRHQAKDENKLGHDGDKSSAAAARPAVT